MSHPPENQGRPQAQKREQSSATSCVYHSETQGRAWPIATTRTVASHTSDDSFGDEHHVHDVDAYAGYIASAPTRAPPASISAATFGPAPGARALADSNVFSGQSSGTSPNGWHDQHDLSQPYDRKSAIFQPILKHFLPHVFYHQRISLAGRTSRTHTLSKRTRHDISFVLWPTDR